MPDNTEILYLDRDIQKLAGRLKSIIVPAEPHPAIIAALASIEHNLLEIARIFENLPHEPSPAQTAEQLASDEPALEQDIESATENEPFLDVNESRSHD